MIFQNITKSLHKTLQLCELHYHVPAWVLSLTSAPEPATSSLYSQPASQYRKRESTVSETTTTTLVGGSNVNNGAGVSAKVSNGGGSALRATSVSPLLMSENTV